MADITASLDAATQQVLALVAQLRLGNVRFLQAQDIGGADATVVAPLPNVTAYGPDLVLEVDFAAPNATTTPKLTVQGLPQVPIQAFDGGAVVVGSLTGKRLLGFASLPGGGYAARMLGLSSADVLALVAANGGIIRLVDTVPAQSSADSIVGRATPNITGTAPGQVFLLTATGAPNATNATNVIVQGYVAATGTYQNLGTLPLRHRDGGAFLPGDIPANATFLAAIDASGNYMRILGMAPADVLALILANGTIGRSAIFQSNGTFQIPNNVTSLEVEVLGGGGAGGASNNSTSGGTLVGNAGGGGGAGGYSYARLTGLAPGAQIPVTVGGGGLPATGAAGGAGGTSSFGTYCSATGGAGGPFGAQTVGYGGSGGQGNGGLFNLAGGQGGASGTNASGTPTQSNILVKYCTGGLAPRGLGSIDLCNTGGNGQGFGNGGSGASGGSGITGGNGAPGLVIVRW